MYCYIAEAVTESQFHESSRSLVEGMAAVTDPSRYYR
jgi:hypothetical protein